MIMEWGQSISIEDQMSGLFATEPTGLFNQKFRKSSATFLGFGVFKYIESAVSLRRTRITGGRRLVGYIATDIKERVILCVGEKVFSPWSGSLFA